MSGKSKHRRDSTFTLLSVGSIDPSQSTASSSGARGQRHAPARDTANDKSHIDELIEAYRKADGQFGAKSLPSLMYDKYGYVAKVRLVAHLSARIGEYMSLLDSMSVNPWNGGSTMSGVWQMIFLLGKAHREFKEADPFMRQLLEYLEKDVRGVLRDWQVEHGRDVIHSPWTDPGREAVTSLVKHLAGMFEDASVALPKGIRSVYDAINILRAPYKKILVSEHITLSSEEYDGLKDFIKQSLFREGHKNLWWTAGLPRAFAIGLADLWRANDYKAILYILRQAVKLHENGDYPEDAPFAWTYMPTALAGPHMCKFTGDSDSLAEFADGLLQAGTCVLPRFQQRLETLKASLEDSVSMAESARLKILTGIFAVIVGAFNQAAKFAFRRELEHTLSAFNATSAGGA